jgi:uncharacterized membrane protein
MNVGVKLRELGFVYACTMGQNRENLRGRADRRQDMSDALQYPVHGPKTLGQILDRVYRLLRANLKPLIGISAAPPVVFYFSTVLAVSAIMLPLFSRIPKIPDSAQNVQIGVAFISFSLVILLLYVAVLAPGLAALSTAAVQADLGSSMSFREAYRRAFQKYWRYALLLVLVFLIAMGPMITIELTAVGVALAIGHGSSTINPAFFPLIPVGFLLLLACVIFSILALLRLSLAFSACVTENLSAMDAIRRSNRLVRGAMGRTFVVVLVIYVIASPRNCLGCAR